MNAAAKYINQNSFLHGQFAGIRMSLFSTLQAFLIVSILVSALAVVYVTNMQRLACSELEKKEQIAHQLHLKWGRLMLEKASLVTPSRIENLAYDKLDMIFPATKNMMVLRTQQ